MPRYYTTSEVAQICNVHRNTIIGSIRKGFLKIYRTPGGHARIMESDLLSFCKERNLPTDLNRSRNDKVLIVDDDPLLVRMLRAGLEKANYRVKVAENGYDAGFMTISWKPDVVLLDIMLPDVQGSKVAKRMRETPVTAVIPIIGMSGVSEPAKIDELMESGANDFIAKPFEISDLVARIVNQVGKLNLDVPITETEQAVAVGA